jgi:hypothetical protein
MGTPFDLNENSYLEDMITDGRKKMVKGMAGSVLFDEHLKKCFAAHSVKHLYSLKGRSEFHDVNFLPTTLRPPLKKCCVRPRTD